MNKSCFGCFGISRASLIEHENNGSLHPDKTIKGHRRYHEDAIKELIKQKDCWPLLIQIARKNYGYLPETLNVIGRGIGSYKRIPVEYTGTQWIIHDPQLKIILAHQIPIEIYFDEIKPNKVICGTNINCKTYQFISGNCIKLSEIVDDINKSSIEHYARVSLHDPSIKHKELLCEMPLFIMGREVNESLNAIFPVVYRCEDTKESTCTFTL